MSWNVLNESEYYRQIFDLASLGVFVGDLHGNCLYINKQWEEISGQTIENAIGKGWTKNIIQEDIPLVYSTIQEAVQMKDKVSFEFRMRHSDRGILVIRSSMRLIEVMGKRYFLGCIQDFTPLRVVEEELKVVNSGLIQSNNEKDRLLKVLAHDLRAPIDAICSISDLLTEDASLNTESNELIKLIQVSSHNTSKMIKSIVDATILNHAETVIKKKVNLSEVLKRTIAILQLRADTKRQKILLKADEQVWADIDEEKIIRVLTNLISNSIKFSMHGTVIVVSIAQLHKVVISIQDQGIGIPLVLQGQVFDPFTAAKRYGTDKEKPFGLGLSICRQIVEAHEGKIWLDSEPDQGTTFYLEL